MCKLYWLVKSSHLQESLLYLLYFNKYEKIVENCLTLSTDAENAEKLS